MFDPGRLMVMAILVLVFLLVVSAKQKRRHLATGDGKQCRNCGGRFAAEAKFCGRCGRPL